MAIFPIEWWGNIGYSLLVNQANALHQQVDPRCDILKDLRMQLSSKKNKKELLLYTACKAFKNSYIYEV